MPLHVLVIEDDDDLGTLIARQLAKADARVSVFSEGREALERLEHMEPLPDLVCLDLALPDVSGFEVCALLRKGARTAKLPVLVLSARNSIDDRARADEVGASAFLAKPFRLKQFLAEVARLTGKQVRA